MADLSVRTIKILTMSKLECGIPKSIILETGTYESIEANLNGPNLGSHLELEHSEITFR